MNNYSIKLVIAGMCAFSCSSALYCAPGTAQEALNKKSAELSTQKAEAPVATLTRDDFEQQKKDLLNTFIIMAKIMQEQQRRAQEEKPQAHVSNSEAFKQSISKYCVWLTALLDKVVTNVTCNLTNKYVDRAVFGTH